MTVAMNKTNPQSQSRFQACVGKPDAGGVDEDGVDIGRSLQQIIFFRSGKVFANPVRPLFRIALTGQSVKLPFRESRAYFQGSVHLHDGGGAGWRSARS